MRGISFRTENAKPSRNAGLSLLEVLVVVAGIGIIASVATVSIGNIKEKVVQQKLSQDVETINRAVRLYELNGGDLSTVLPHPWWILGSLKSKVTNMDIATGLTGRMIDPRLQAEIMTSHELSSDDPRAVWNVSARRFDIITDNSVAGAKVKRFKVTDDTWIDELLTNYFLDRADTRSKRAFDYASTDTWVWDYSDTAAAALPGPTGIPLSPGVPTTPGAPAPSATPLDPPGFSLSGGSHPLLSFPIALEVLNPNDAAVSEVYSWTRLTGWLEYDGTPIPVMPGTAIKAFARSTDTDWTDSPFADSSYEAIAVTLETGLTAPGSVNWGQAGGPIQPGGPAPVLATPGEISILNEASIPDMFESNSNFMVYWTTDGSDPLSSPTRNGVSAFTGGFPGQSLDVSLAAFGTNSSLPLRVAAESLNADYFNSSGVVDHTVAISKTDLRNPVVTDVAAMVTIDLETSFGDMPEGARVYYTLNGIDPGNAGGDPVTGTEYTGPFSVKWLGTPSVPVSARVYGPDGYEHWFNTSSAFSMTVAVPPAVMAFSHSASISAPGL